MANDIILNSTIENLVIFRHGKAERPHDAPDDYSRDLVERGRKDAFSQAERLKELGFWPDYAIVSSAYRAAQTWDEVAKVFTGVKSRVTRDLYLASPQIYLQNAINCAVKNVILIAHDPGLHDLCRHFLKGSDMNDDEAKIDAHYLLSDLPTAGAAWFQKDANSKSAMRLIVNLRPIKTAD